VVGGSNLCGRVSGIHAGTYDVGPAPAGPIRIGQPVTINFRIRDFGSGDYIIYPFGKVDWGDNSQQNLMPLDYNVTLSHTYTSSPGAYSIHVMGGAQFKYQGNGSGSYEACVDNSIPVQIAP